MALRFCPLLAAWCLLFRHRRGMARLARVLVAAENEKQRRKAVEETEDVRVRVVPLVDEARRQPLAAPHDRPRDIEGRPRDGIAR